MKRFLAVVTSYGANRLVVASVVLVPSLMGVGLVDLGHIELLLASVSLSWSLGPMGADGITHRDYVDRKADWFAALALAATGGALIAASLQATFAGRWIVLAVAIGSVGAVQKVTQARLRVDDRLDPMIRAVGAMLLCFAGVFWILNRSLEDAVRSSPLALLAGLAAFAIVGISAVQSRLFEDGSRFRSLIRFGLPLAIANLFTEIIALADRFLIQWMMGTESVGLYGVTYRWVSLLGSMGAAVATYWNAEAFRRGAGWALSMAQRYVRRWLLTLVLAAAAAWYPIVWLTAKTLDLPTSSVDVEVGWLLAGAVAFVFGTQVISVLASAHRSMSGAAAKGVGAVLNIGLNLMVIPRWGLAGAAFATAVAQVTVAVVAWRHMGRTVREQVEKDPLEGGEANTGP